MAIKTNVERMITNFTCGYCLTQPGYAIVFADYSALRPYGIPLEIGRAFAVVRCRHCKMLNVLVFSVEDDEPLVVKEEDLQLVMMELDDDPQIIDPRWDWDKPSDRPADTRPTDLPWDDGFEVAAPERLNYMGQYPYGHRLGDSIPRAIRQDIQEAGSCLAINAANACTIMCRRAIERLAKSFNIDTKRKEDLRKLLQKLRDQGHTDGTLFDALNEIRNWGNIGAHADEEESIALDEARRILELVTQAIEYAYSNQKERLERSTRHLSACRAR